MRMEKINKKIENIIKKMEKENDFKKKLEEVEKISKKIKKKMEKMNKMKAPKSLPRKRRKTAEPSNVEISKDSPSPEFVMNPPSDNEPSSGGSSPQEGTSSSVLVDTDIDYAPQSTLHRGSMGMGWHQDIPTEKEVARNKRTCKKGKYGCKSKKTEKDVKKSKEKSQPGRKKRN